MSKPPTIRTAIVERQPMPTPLYVTQRSDKSVTLRFNTQEEADLAWRILSALAEAHADRTHTEQELDIAQKLLAEHGHKWPEPGTPEYEDMIQAQRESWGRQDKD